MDRNKRTPKYSNGYYLDKMINMLQDVVSWKALIRVLAANNTKLKPGHESTIRKKYNKWCNLGIFKKSYEEFIVINGGLNKDNTKTLFIDGTMIHNKHGTDKVSINPTDPKKRATKLVVVSTTRNNKFRTCHR